MSSLPKPILRGHIKRQGIKAILGAFVFSAVNSSLYYFFVTVPHKRKYDEFLKTYDAEAHFKDLDKWGYLNYKAILAEIRNPEQ